MWNFRGGAWVSPKKRDGAFIFGAYKDHFHYLNDEQRVATS